MVYAAASMPGPAQVEDSRSRLIAAAGAVLGEHGWVDGSESLFGFPAGEMQSDRVAAEVRQQQLLHPLLLVRDALGDPSLASEAGSDGVVAQLVIEDPVHPITLWIDEAKIGRASCRERVSSPV